MPNFPVKKIAILINPQGSSGVPGGICVVVTKLLQGLNYRNFELDLIVQSAEAAKLFPGIPSQVRIINLNTQFQVRFKSAVIIISPLSKYLKKEKPDALICHLTLVNYLTVIARLLTRSLTHLILVEHFPFLELQKQLAARQKSFIKVPFLYIQRWLYLQANAIVAVSQGVAKSFEAGLGLSPGSVKVIYNPVVDRNLLHKAKTPLENYWFSENQPPVILTVGRLLPPKDFSTLIQAFAKLRKKRPLRLLILGEGDLRPKLESLITKLGIDKDVSLPGYTSNPYSYMAKSAVFVLSSNFEGLPTVMIEALACNCQVVATDCPYGPKEILANGEFGRLVPVGDVSALALAIELALDKPLSLEKIKQRSENFTVESSVDSYLKLFV